ncbi:hypothetical protein D9V34_03620 [Mycetocola lacteus]|uniref:PLAT domain-containing protein n=1 Tax=Mycetocola lacteus TaxID=76637 RepID=A0A3L7ATW2_9MICO|nr:hypothetical protein [Mycetocola lacteus]RLP83907.1 hypothetical protein D9V34_03620 [Mycetocola lacteus]
MKKSRDSARRVLRAAPMLVVAGLALAGCAVAGPDVAAGPSSTASQRVAPPTGSAAETGGHGEDRRDRDRESPQRHVEIRVTGDASSALIRDFTVLESENRRHLDHDVREAENAAAATEHELPWSTEFDLTLDANGDYQKVIVWAQNTAGNLGEVRCEIYVDGERKSHHDEDGTDSVVCDKKLDLD